MTTAFIFDFDGTLVDSEKAIYKCFHNITKQLAPERIDYVKNILIGPPLRETASEILGPKHQDRLDKFVRLFIEMHDEQVIEHTLPYPGVTEVLKQLYAKNIPMAIATNKRLAPTQKLIGHFAWNHYFLNIECCDSQKKIRNKTEMIQNIINNKFFEKVIFVGDTVNDGLCCNKLNINFIHALYGYGKKQNWSKVKTYNKISKFSDLINYIL